jgi:hypothetical protein
MPDQLFETDHFEAHLVGAEVGDHTVPVEVLVRMLKGLQQTYLLLEASREQKPVQTRFVPSEALRKRSELRCGPVKEGSVAIDLSAEVIPGTLAGREPLKKLLHVLLAVASANQAMLSELIPDSLYRKRVLQETRSYLPKAGQRWGIEVRRDGLSTFDLNYKTRQQIDTWFTADIGEAVMTVTGRLASIDFRSNRVAVEYPPTGRLLTFAYEVDVEDSLIQARRDWVQVRGTFKLDKEGLVTSVRKALQVEPLDLSPLTFDTVTEGEVNLLIDPPLSLELKLDEETYQFLTADDADLNVIVGAETREELAAEVNSRLAFMWMQYVQDESVKLSPAALRLRSRLVARMRSVS